MAFSGKIIGQSNMTGWKILCSFSLSQKKKNKNIEENQKNN